MSNLLITGGCGFIGSNFVKYIKENTQHNIVLIVDSLTYASNKNPNWVIDNPQLCIADIVDVNWEELLNTHKPDFIVHFAAESHVDNSLDLSANDIFFHSNVLGTKKILDGLVKSNKKQCTRLIHISSVVGSTPVLVKDEQDRVKYVPINTFHDTLNINNYKILTLDNNKKVCWKSIKQFLWHPIDETYKIYYNSGGEVECSESHSVFVWDSSGIHIKLVKDLSIGDYLVTPNLQTKLNERFRYLNLQEFTDLFLNSNIRKSIQIRKDILLKNIGAYTSFSFLKKYKYLNFNNTKTEKALLDIANNFRQLTWDSIKEALKIPDDKLELTNDLCWLFGLYLAEGHSSHTTKEVKKYLHQITFCVGLNEYDKVIKAKNILNTLGISIYIYKRDSSYLFSFSNKWLYCVFSEFNHLAHTKTLPTWMFNLDTEQFKNFLSGYEGDAHIKKTGSRIFTSVNKNLLEQILWLCRLHGISGSISSRICKHSYKCVPPNCINPGNFIYYDLCIPAYEYNKVSTHRTPQANCVPSKDVKNYIKIPTKYCWRNKQLLSKDRLVKWNKDGILNDFIFSDVGVSVITKIEKINKVQFVYDFSVEDTECFFGGNVPILLHNTDEVLGDLPYTTLQSLDEDSPLNPNNIYSATKASAELLVKSYQHTFNNFEYTICRATNNFGPNQHPEKLIPKVIAKAMDNKDIPVYGSGKNVRDWLWTEDFAAGLVAVIDKYASKKSIVANKIYHFGGAESISNIKLVKKILHIMNRPNDLITFVPDRLGHDRVYSLDFSRATNNLGWVPKIKLDEGLHLLVEEILRKRGW